MTTDPRSRTSGKAGPRAGNFPAAALQAEGRFRPALDLRKFAASITFFFLRRYLKQLTAQQTAGRTGHAAAASAPAGLHPCPRCNKSIAKGTAFCPHCGAALAIWHVHRAAARSGGAAKGKPKPVINASLCVGCGSCVHICPVTETLALVAGKARLSLAWFKQAMDAGFDALDYAARDPALTSIREGPEFQRLLEEGRRQALASPSATPT